MDRENRQLNFVLKYYAPGRFDTRRALAAYKSLHPVRLSVWRKYVAGAAAIFALCFAVGYFLMRGEHDVIRLYASDASVSYLLPDSSEVVLYPHSSLSYNRDHFGTGSRDVGMTGQVEFKVHKDPGAPFTVTTVNAAVRVLGTEFTVEELQGDSVTSVNVKSGKVLFKAKDKKDGVVLTAGMFASLERGVALPEIITTEDGGGTAAVHKFVFDRTPLADVLKELSEYFNIGLSCRTEGKVLTAEFETDNLDEIIMMIEKSLNVKIEKTGK